MVTEIAGDLRRSGMDADIKLAIAAAAEFYRTQRLGKFNTQTFDFSTVIAREYYDSTNSTSIPLIAIDDGLIILDTTNLAAQIILKKKPTEWIDQNTLGAAYRTSPEFYALTRDKVRLFPIPAAVQTIRFNGVLEVVDATQAVGLTRLSRDGVAALPGNYASAWFTNGLAYEAMKAWAKGNLFFHKLRNQQEAAGHFSASSDYIEKLTAQGAAIEGEDFVAATSF